MPPVAAPSRGTSAPKDILNFEELQTRCMGNTEFANRMIVKFQAQLVKDVTEIAQASTANDLSAVEQIAHRVKGASANVAAKAVMKVAVEIETAAERGDADTVWSRLPILQAERDRLERIIPVVLTSVVEAS